MAPWWSGHHLRSRPCRVCWGSLRSKLGEASIVVSRLWSRTQRGLRNMHNHIIKTSKSSVRSNFEPGTKPPHRAKISTSEHTHTGHTREPDPTHLELKHKTTHTGMNTRDDASTSTFTVSHTFKSQRGKGHTHGKTNAGQTPNASTGHVTCTPFSQAAADRRTKLPHANVHVAVRQT